MDSVRWAAVDDFLARTIAPQDEILLETLEASDAGGLPAIAVSGAQGKLLQLLAAMLEARSVLEIGTLGGYSTICLARGIAPGGRVITLEIDPERAAIAASNIARAGFADRVEIRIGPALETLPRLADGPPAPFDLVFIDADKANTPAYFRWAMKLARAGAVILVDNVVRDGALIDMADNDPAVLGVRRLHEMIADDPRVSATTIQTVGSKGYDGFLLALILPDRTFTRGGANARH